MSEVKSLYQLSVLALRDMTLKNSDKDVVVKDVVDKDVIDKSENDDVDSAEEGVKELAEAVKESSEGVKDSGKEVQVSGSFNLFLIIIFLFNRNRGSQLFFQLF